MRSYVVSLLVAAGLFAGCGVGELEQGIAAKKTEALTSADVDVPPECEGLLTFVNTASFETLDLYLPSDTAANIVGARPFSTLEELSAVSGVGATRLTQLHQGATIEGYLTATCVGVYDELAVSADDQAAMVALVNGISDTELHDIMPNAWNGAVNLLAGRPYATALAISATSGVGPVSFRGIRNASTLSQPFEALADAVNALHRDARMLRHFDWWQELTTAEYAYQLSGMTCFGVDPKYLPNGTVIRPDLATPAEVSQSASQAVAYANRQGGLTVDPAIGLANLSEQTQGKTFFGCYISYANDPWSGNNLAFFVDPVTGYSVLTETWWSE
jgi:hypothetical protein